MVEKEEETNYKKLYHQYRENQYKKQRPLWVTKAIDSIQQNLQRRGLYGELLEDEISNFERNPDLWLDQNAFSVLLGTNKVEEYLNKAGITVNDKLSFVLQNNFLNYRENDMTYEMFEDFHFELEKELHDNFWYHGNTYLYN